MSFLNWIKPFRKKEPFVIIAYARMGSYLLVDLLSQFDDIVCFGEIFKKEVIELPNHVLDRLGYDIEKRDQKPLAFVKKVIGLHTDKHTGFKLLCGQGGEARDWAEKSKNVRMIVLVRNPFEVYVSLRRAQATQIWIDRGHTNQEVKPRLKFIAEDFDREIQYIQNYIRSVTRLADSNPKTTKLVDYKDLSDPDTIKRLATFIGAVRHPEKIAYRLRKQTKEPYSELFENFDEMAEYVEVNYL